RREAERQRREGMEGEDRERSEGRRRARPGRARLLRGERVRLSRAHGSGSAYPGHGRRESVSVLVRISGLVLRLLRLSVRLLVPVSGVLRFLPLLRPLCVVGVPAVPVRVLVLLRPSPRSLSVSRPLLRELLLRPSVLPDLQQRHREQLRRAG